MKQSFLIYLSQYEAIKETLSFEDKGLLFVAICEYNFNDKVIELPPSVKVAFNFMKSQFDRNSEKYEAICERNRNNGSKGGRPKKTEVNPENPVGYLGNPEKPKKPDNDNDNDKDIENNISIKFEEFRKKFPGSKRGSETELQNFLKKNKPETVEQLLPALEKEINHKSNLKTQNRFCPEWKNLQTWINQKCWEQELPDLTVSNFNSNTNGSNSNYDGNKQNSIQRGSRQTATADQHINDPGFGLR